MRRRVGYRDIDAVKDVTFSIRRGETFGVIGANGAGKSSLLRVLSGILRPSAGRLRIRGRVAPILGLGAGFHLDLSGRENIVLNGRLLGMSQHEMTDRFEDIIEFSGLGEFIESPVRTYSSGMRARLGFAVAQSVAPDVILLDEVIAVGDRNFRLQCLDRMNEMVSEGATVVLVSHALPMVSDYCDRVLWMDRGKAQMVGPAGKVIQAYEEFEDRIAPQRRTAPAKHTVG
jgi:ABC-type polysaccharide/polyol phosphate transport system ATPase subunit